ncbi:hypothetical protein [Desulfovibrio sp. SGI.169]|uniref:hypothetical protein n=1 Tax=Desulfovibrio sp. SGI.169 TaxID=3420561 RepID=UPI003CFEE522
MPWIETEKPLIPMFGSDITSVASFRCSLTGRIRYLAFVSDEIYLRKMRPDLLRKLRVRNTPRLFHKRRKLRNMENIDFRRVKGGALSYVAGFIRRKIFFPLFKASGHKRGN